MFAAITRNIREEDHAEIIRAVDEWWGGRRMSGMLPRLFFRYFRDTSFAVEEDGRVVAFLIGFVARSPMKEAYIHFVGVHLEYRRRGIAGGLYGRFFEEARKRGCETVRCITSPVNEGSIAFHTRMGFRIEAGDGEAGGVPVHKDYDGPGRDRVVFTRRIS